MEGNGNSIGARFAGMRPDLGPFGERIANPGLNALQVIESAAKNGWDFLQVAGANPAKKYPSTLWMEARAKTGFLVVQDLFLTETAQQADVVLPVLSSRKGRILHQHRGAHTKAASGERGSRKGSTVMERSSN